MYVYLYIVFGRLALLLLSAFQLPGLCIKPDVFFG